MLSAKNEISISLLYYISGIGLNTNTCEALDVGKKDRDFLVAVDVDLVELGWDEFTWKSESSQFSKHLHSFKIVIFPKKVIRDMFVEWTVN